MQYKTKTHKIHTDINTNLSVADRTTLHSFIDSLYYCKEMKQILRTRTDIYESILS